MRRTRPIEERFWGKVRRAEDAVGCWEWQGARYPHGYGAFGVGGRTIHASRFAYELLIGPIPPGLLVCHRCDNPPCVRPDHLFLGTQSNNMADCARKGRSASGERNGPRKRRERMPRGDQHWTKRMPDRIARGARSGAHTHPERLPRGDDHWTRRHPERRGTGERNPMARLSAEHVQIIRYRVASGEMQKTLAAEFGVGRATISRIVNHLAWTT